MPDGDQGVPGPAEERTGSVLTVSCRDARGNGQSGHRSITGGRRATPIPKGTGATTEAPGLEYEALRRMYKGVVSRVRHTSIVMEVGVVTPEETFSLQGLCLE